MPEDEPSPPEPAPGRATTYLRELPVVVAVALTISVLVRTFVAQAFYIPSESMEDTLLVNDRVLVYKLADQPDEIHRGDVVVFHDPGNWLAPPSGRGGLPGAARDVLVFVGLAPSSTERDLVKRVIAVGGDRVACCDSHKRVTVNGVPLDEPYLYPADRSAPSLSQFTVDVPEGRLWVMGDHRSDSADSRAHLGDPGGGTVPVSDVIGRAVARVWPPGRIGRLEPPDTFRQARLAHRGG